MADKEYNPEDAVFEIVEQTVTEQTKVVLTFPDATTKELLIPHFQPRDQAEIEQGIKNRWVSELRALDTAKLAVAGGEDPIEP